MEEVVVVGGIGGLGELDVVGDGLGAVGVQDADDVAVEPARERPAQFERIEGPVIDRDDRDVVRRRLRPPDVEAPGKELPRKVESWPNQDETIPAAFSDSLDGEADSTNGSESISFSCASKNGSGRRDRSRCGGNRSSVSVSVEVS